MSDWLWSFYSVWREGLGVFITPLGVAVGLFLTSIFHPVLFELSLLVLLHYTAIALLVFIVFRVISP
jgi:hypothetical protein